MAGSLFYGISILNARVQEQLLALVKELEPLVPRATWTNPDKFHVTLRFLGNTPIDPAADRLMGLQFDSFTAEVKGAGYFVNSKGPRVLFAELTNKPHFRALYEALGGQDIYNPHLTIAKLEGRGDHEPEFAQMAANLKDHVFGPFLVSSVKLYETQGNGLPYKVVAERRLTT